VPRDRSRSPWVQLAADDLEAAHLLMDEGLYHLACFHAQQAAEKILKAFLVARRQASPREHHLGALLRQVHRAGLKRSGLEPACRILDQYYIPTRYPDAVVGSLPKGLPSRRHAAEAIQLATEIFESIRARYW